MRTSKSLERRYISLLENVVNRAEAVKIFTTFLVKKTNWSVAPSSRRTGMTLIEHSICVTEVLIKMSKAVESGILDESLTICGLFHDIGKLGAFIGDEFYPRFLKTGSGYVYNEKIAEVALGARTLYFVSKFVPLNEEEIQALVSSEGLYNNANEFMKYKETGLALLLHYADYWVSHMVQKGNKFVYDKEPWFVR